MLKTSSHALSASRKHTIRFLAKNFGGMLCACGVDGHLLMAVKSLYSSSYLCRES